MGREVAWETIFAFFEARLVKFRSFEIIPIVKSSNPLLLFFVMAAMVGCFTWVFGVRGVRILALQHRAESFPSVRGKVLSGEVIVAHGSKGSVHYHPSIAYRYEVAGRSYLGRRYRYDGRPSFWDSTPANQIVKAHPKGSEIDVYYNPADPSDAVLSTPVEAFDFSLLLTILPLWLLGIFGMIRSAREITWPRRTEPIAGGVRIISDRMTTRVRLPQRDPLSWSLLTIGVLAFVAGLVMNAESNFKVRVAEILLLLIPVAGAVVYFWLRRKISSGSQDLIIDEAARTLQLPLTYKRRERMQFAFSEITGVSLEKVAHRGKYGVRYTYAPTLQIAGKEPQRLTDLSKKRAESFATWLRERLGLPADAGVTLLEK
jgi:hypothetical protein